MSIQYALLGLLSLKPSTGYELKKQMEDSSIMHWSGNNNQIYKPLVQLLNEGLVTSETLHQERSPSKKVYTITAAGLDRLRAWTLEEPEVPEFRNPFLVRLMWAEQLGDEELRDLLRQYERKLELQLLYEQEKIRRGASSAAAGAREQHVWAGIFGNLLSYYCNELQWVRGMLNGMDGERLNRMKPEEAINMNIQLIDVGGKTYVELLDADRPLGLEQDAVDLVGLCMEHGTDRLLLHSRALSPDFFQLRTRVAGNMIQKFVTYRIRAAVVVPEELSGQGRFREMALEINKGSEFRISSSKEEAEQWLMREA